MTNILNEVGRINEAVLADPAGRLALDDLNYRSQLQNVVDNINTGDGLHTIILLAGPSGSGKTTSAHIFSEMFARRGTATTIISMDNFYRGREHAPLHEDGTHDYETVHALDLPVLHDCFLSLIETGHCVIPRFDFMTGARAADSIDITMPRGSIAIVEGIHAMNPLIVDTLPQDRLRTVYVRVANGVLEDGREEEILTPRNLRLIRRMIRDSIFRNSPPENTFSMWASVVKGEAKYLTPFKDRADFKINSFHSCEPCLFREELLRLCRTVEEDDPGYQYARTLMAGIAPFASMDKELVPEDCLLREFIGGSKYED